MALTVASSFTEQASAVTSITSASVSTAVNDVVIVSCVIEGNNFAGTLSISNTGAALTWNSIAVTNAPDNCKVAAWWAKVATAGNITATVNMSGTGTVCSLGVDVYTGAHQTTPVPAGNVFSGVNGTDISQVIIPTATGSMLRMVAGDWAATNTFAPIANVTLEQTFHQAGAYTSAFLKPTSQPLGTASFTIGETDTSGTIAWVAFEVVAAPDAPAQAVYLSKSKPLKKRAKLLTNNVTGIDTFNPFTQYSPDMAILNAFSGSLTHDTSGSLTGQGSLISGASNHITIHSSAGALVGQSSALTGSANRTRQHPASGDLISQGSVITGSAQHNTPHSTSGVLTGQGTAITGTANRTRDHQTTGGLIGQGSAIAGTAQHNVPHQTTGSLLGQGAEITGSAARASGAISHDATGALSGQSALISGAANRTRQHPATGGLVGQGSQATGSAQHNIPHGTSGSLTAQGSEIAGAASRVSGVVSHDGTGALSGQGATVTGTASRTREHIANGDLVTQGATLSGNANRFHAFSSSGLLIGQGSEITGNAARIGAPVTHTTSGSLAGSGSELSGNGAITGGGESSNSVYKTRKTGKRKQRQNQTAQYAIKEIPEQKSADFVPEAKIAETIPSLTDRLLDSYVPAPIDPVIFAEIRQDGFLGPLIVPMAESTLINVQPDNLAFEQEAKLNAEIEEEIALAMLLLA